jgi:hypothetical protein
MVTGLASVLSSTVDGGAEIAVGDRPRGVGEALGQSDQLGGNRSGHVVACGP